MNIKTFIENNYLKAINLKKAFQITEKKEWNALTVLSELVVQLGHLSFIVEGNDRVGEQGRNISNLGDEVSDVILQIFALSWKLDFDLVETFKRHYCGDSISDMLTLTGQITEAVMEINDFRHRKIRLNFKCIEEFVIFKINCLICVVFDFCKCYNVDIKNEFENMIIDATNFLKNYEGE